MKNLFIAVVATLAVPIAWAAGDTPKASGAPPADAIHAGVAKVPAVADAKVAKAQGANARTVGQVYADRITLKGKEVVIRAKVVKVNAGIMGKNWVHLRDGSGSATDNSNDLLATSKDEPKVGDVVIAKGTVRTDVDLGSGYAYKVLIEDVSFK